MTYLPRDDMLSWGRITCQSHPVATPRFRNNLAMQLNDRPTQTLLPVGLRRSYGDTVLNSAGSLMDMTALDRLIAFDPQTGIVRAEAGLSLDALLRHIVPMGFFVPVTPGSRFVTLGGAVANDVHGKNHHRAGTFGCHLLNIGLQRSDGSFLEVSPNKHKALFAATIGGMGLTGIISWVELQLQRISAGYLDVEMIPYAHLNAFWDLADDSSQAFEHTVSWIDCAAKGKKAGRGIFIRANWSETGELKPHNARQRLKIPCDAPSWFLNPFTIKRFNQLYYHAHRFNAGHSHQHYAPFFYPLDNIANWNRLYGPKGFWQYQCVIPNQNRKEATAALISEIAQSAQGSFLAVLKTFGPMPSPGLLSFPMEGVTLALDFPNKGQETLKLFARLDTIVSNAGGRLYAAKDGRITGKMFHEGYPALEEFHAHIDPACQSDFWKRVNDA
jgi:L-gulonolactone oxidase